MTVPEMRSRRAGDVLLAMGWLMSVALVIGGLYFGIPWLLESIPSPGLAVGAVLLFVPAISSLTLLFQGRIRPSLSTLWLVFLEELAGLLFELLSIVLVLPIVTLSMAIAAISAVLVVFIIGFALVCLQDVVGIELGVARGLHDLGPFGLILLGLLVLLGILLAIRRCGEKGTESLAGRCLAWRRAILGKLRRHRA